VYDAIVVGGGPAGLVTAETVAAAGLQTLLVEREAEIGEPVHTSGATAPETMVRFGVPGELHHGVHRLRFAGVGRDVAFEYGEPVLSIIDVRGVYRFLADRAAAAGCDVRTGAAASAAVLDGGRVVGCRILDEDVAARVVVDAGGYRSAISKSAGLHPGFTRFGVGAEYELLAPRVDQDEAVLVVGSRYAPAGYGWAFPWGEGRVRVGVGVHHADVRDDPRRLLELLVADAAELGIDLAGATETEYHHGLIPADGLATRFAADGIVAVGDAACQATLVVGEGIRMSMDAGRLAGETIVTALRAGSAEETALRPYEDAFRRRYARSLRLGYTINQRLASFDDAEWAEKLDLLERLPPELVPKLLQSQFPLQTALRGFVRRPALWPRAARYAARGVKSALTSSRD
jgi:digeranylgeranylglycerophospholipid reductase